MQTRQTKHASIKGDELFLQLWLIPENVIIPWRYKQQKCKTKTLKNTVMVGFSPSFLGCSIVRMRPTSSTSHIYSTTA